MCHGQNSAHRVVHYLNAQLGVHWENAVTCLEHSGRSSTLAASAQYDVALAQYHYAPGSQHHHSKTSSQDAVMFRAVFGKPRLEFICNHQAVLYLKIKEGHYDVDYTKGEGHRRSRSHKVELNDLELAFRMDFSTETMPRVHNSKSRPGNQLIHLVVLDFSAAQLVSKVDLNGPQDAIIFYLRKYLDLLQEAGHDVLFSLPEFDDDRLGLHIDHSIDSHSIQNFDPRCQPSSISGVSIGDVNDHLASKWLQAAIHAEDVERGYVELDRQAVCLAESRSTWLVGSEGWDTQFHVKFGAPEVKILCKREVSFHLKVDELMVYEGSDFTLGAKRLFSDWEVVFLVGLICEKEAEGAITRLKLDMSSIRFCERLAVFTNLDASDPSTHSFKPRLVHFFHTYYFPFIESTSHHIIYQEDTRQPQTPSTYGRSRSRSGTVTSTTPSENKSLLPWELSVRKTNMCGFDFIQVISSESISEHYKTLWGAAQSSEEDYVRCLWKWSYDHYFEATFGPLTLHFLSSGKVILWVDVKEGHLQNLRNWLAWSEEKEYRFKDWRLAFQVDLKMFDHGEVSWSSKSWIHRFMESFSLRKDIVQGHCTVRHLCLDLSNAQFIYELSTFHGMTLSHRAALRRVRAAAYYVKEHYFHYLTYYGHHLLYSIPFWHPGTSPPPMALTDVSFQVHSTHGSIHHKHEPKWSTTDASIFILGMTSFRRPPSTPVDFTANWIAQAREGLSHGIVSLSKKLFLEDHLLRILAKVNAETTIVPVFPAVDGEGDWHLELTTWSKRRKGKECRWELVRDHERRIGYKWENCDKWIYEHEGADEDGDNGVYAMACQTRNHLHFPSRRKESSLDIVVQGEVTVQLKFKGESTQWSTKSSAKWTCTLTMATSPAGGMSFSVSGDMIPKVETSHTNAESSNPKLTALNTLLESQLPRQVDLFDLSTILERSFGGVWEHCFPNMQAYSLCNPVFNRHGDILFELQPHSSLVQVPPSPAFLRPGVGMRRSSNHLGVPRPLSVVSTVSLGPSRPSSPLPSLRSLKSASFLRRSKISIQDAFENGHSEDLQSHSSFLGTSTPRAQSPAIHHQSKEQNGDASFNSVSSRSAACYQGFYGHNSSPNGVTLSPYTRR